MTARLALACAMALGCARSVEVPPATTPEGALVRLRDALASGGDWSPQVDALLLPHAEFLVRMDRVGRFQDGHAGGTAEGFTEAGWRSLLDDLATAHSRERTRARVERLRARLGDGRCARAIEGALPEALAQVPEARPEWPAVGRSLRAEVAGRAARATAAVYRCRGGGGPVRVVTAPRSATDPTRVLVEWE